MRLQSCKMLSRLLLAVILTLGATTAPGQEPACIPDPQDAEMACPAIDPPLARTFSLSAEVRQLMDRLARYDALGESHRLAGLASYYSSFFDGRKTANGEIYRNGKISAAHLTLPLGTWIEVTARKSGKKIRMRVNDRGPYARKFMLDLSQAAAKALGVHVGNREVEVRVIALPGEEPLREDYEELLARLEIPDAVEGSEQPAVTAAR
jgi:rare lipoprotein A (peptidoglycan hydrolase)